MKGNAVTSGFESLFDGLDQVRIAANPSRVRVEDEMAFAVCDT
jgi:hypothetical protein